MKPIRGFDAYPSSQLYFDVSARFYQTMMEKNRKARLWNQQRLRALKRTYGDQVDIHCSHDLTEFECFAGRSAEIPAEHMVGGEYRSGAGAEARP